MQTREAAIAFRNWARQFDDKPDNERVTVLVKDLKFFTRLCLTLLEAFDDGGKPRLTLVMGERRCQER